MPMRGRGMSSGKLCCCFLFHPYHAKFSNTSTDSDGAYYTRFAEEMGGARQWSTSQMGDDS
jgi:hypothetical protein